MAEFICFLGKESSIVIKPTKKSASFLRMIYLVFAMTCGVYICLTCLNQINHVTRFKFKSLEAVKRSSFSRSLHLPRFHYPKPKTFSRAECWNNKVHYFVIMSMQRSGSGWFETLLNSHPNVSSNGEIFSVINRRKNISSITEILNKVYNLDWFTSASKNECSAAVGFKWMLNQGLMDNHREIVKYYNRKGVSVIFLFRRNLLRRMVSVLANIYDSYAKPLNGTHKSHVHSSKEADVLSRYKPIINTKSLIYDLKKSENEATKALEYFNSTRHIVLYYEDLITNRTTLKQVQEFLKIPVMKLRSRQVKIHRGDLSGHVQNWEDVAKTLNGTEYEKFLRSDY